MIRLTLNCPAACPLLNSCTPVPGEGPTTTDILLVGEAPGANEVDQQRPFIGRAGTVLNRILKATGLNRTGVRVSNVVCCRPTDDDGDNRTPTPAEVAACVHHLLQEIQVVQPKLVIALGETAANVFFGPGAIGKMRGRLRCDGARLYGCTYHPAAVFRHPDLFSVIVQDIQRFLAVK